MNVAGPSSNYTGYLDLFLKGPGNSRLPPTAEIGQASTSRGDPKPWNYYVLESESPQSSDEGSETALSIQGKETDCARDTSDLDSDSDAGSGTFLEYEIATDEDTLPGDPGQFVDSHQSGSEDDVMEATVISAVLAEGDFLFADSEDSLTAPSVDPELSPFDYWYCAQCRNTNNNPMFRYCEKCYKLRKDFFPPPPKKRRKNRTRSKRSKKAKEENSVQNNIAAETPKNPPEGTGLNFQSIGKLDVAESNESDAKTGAEPPSEVPQNGNALENNECPTVRKRKNEDDFHINPKKSKTDFLNLQNKSLLNIDIYDEKDSVDSFSQPIFPNYNSDVEPVAKSLSDSVIKFCKDDLDIIGAKAHFSDDSNLSPLARVESLSNCQKTLKNDQSDDMCITCLVEPKSGVFVHGRIAHICCCYKCSIKVWMKSKRCPICNCKVSNVLKAFVM